MPYPPKAEQPKPAPRAPRLLRLEAEFADLVASGAKRARLEAFLVGAYTGENRQIRDRDFQGLDPARIEDDYLRPRRDLLAFVVDSWIRHIFLPSLRVPVAESILVFGLGRLFSTYNDIGAQCCTDADLNVIVADHLEESEMGYLRTELARLRKEVLDRFGVGIELSPEFTLMREGTVSANLSHPDLERRNASALFYKSNERSIHLFRDHPTIREKVFSRVRPLPDSCIFEHFLGLRSAKCSFLKLHLDKVPLAIVEDASGRKVQVRTLIGSRAFDLYCRKVFPAGSLASPPEWHFSMKYFVNRVYDYAGAMRNAGHGLADIGFDRKDGSGGADPDYRFLRDAHKLMLYLQELLELGMGAFGNLQDYSFISAGRFLRFMELGGEKFRRDFASIVLGGELLLRSAREQYQLIEGKIQDKARDRFLEGRTQDLGRFPPGFSYETIHRSEATYKICVPWSWGDLGYFVFERIAARMCQIVDTRLLPALQDLEGKGACKG